MVDSHGYWNTFYAGRRSNAVPSQPSAFAEWVAERLEPDQTVVEFGFGNGRDSFWFARAGYPVRAYDFAESAVDQGRGRIEGSSLDVELYRLDLYDSEATSTVGAKLGDLAVAPLVYGRFLIHSLKEHGRRNLFDMCACALARGGLLALEFRTGKDRDAEHVFGDDHFRIYLDPSAVEDELRERGAVIDFSEAGHGLAVFKSEDPHVARIVARWDC